MASLSSTDIEMKSVCRGSFPRAIIHIDADAFFASVEQMTHPELRGKPVVTGAERGMVTSMSYEAKALGIPRGMAIFEVKRRYPKVVVMDSDYRKYSLLSMRIFAIVRRYTSEVEEASLDECYADISGLQRPLNMTYQEIVEAIQRELNLELGCTFSIGLAPTKLLAKLASGMNKPCGITIIKGHQIPYIVRNVPIQKVCGIGDRTTSYLQKYGVTTILDFIYKDAFWVDNNLPKPLREMYLELRGVLINKVQTAQRIQKSIQRVKSFNPTTNDREMLLAELSKNCEAACATARKYKLVCGKFAFGLRTEGFYNHYIEVTLETKCADPMALMKIVHTYTDQLFKKNYKYRSTGIALMDLQVGSVQMDLFGANTQVCAREAVLNVIDKLNKKHGKFTIYTSQSHGAVMQAKERSTAKEQKIISEGRVLLLPGESIKRRMYIPYLGEVK